MTETSPPHNDTPPTDPPAPIDPPPTVSQDPPSNEIKEQIKALTEVVTKLVARDDGPPDQSPAKTPWLFKGRRYQ